MRAPRFLWVPFELGRPFGAPNEPDFQRRVVHEALGLLERTDGPVVLADFPDDAPASDDDTVWACPVSYAPTGSDESDLLAAIRREIGQLASWADLAPAPAATTGLPVGAMVDRLVAIAERAGDDPVDIEAVRLPADDLRTWYLHAVAQQPGRATSHDRNTWFWRQTAAARLLGRVAMALVDHDEPRVRTFARRGVVPRDHWELLTSGD